MGEPKKHHFVPQFLLRGLLAEGSQQLFVFDKWTERSWKSSTRDIAAEHKFNVISGRNSELDLEPFMAKMEAAVAPLFDKIRTTRSLRWVGAKARRQLALFTAAQMLRTPAALARYKAFDDLISQAIRDRGGDPWNVDGYRPFQPGEEKIAWGDSYVKDTPRIATHLQMKDWFLFSTDTSSFLMSDAPVTLFNHIERAGRGNLGVACDGIQIHLPISQHLTLAFVCRSIRRELISSTRSLGWNPLRGRSIEERRAIASAKEIIGAVRTGRPLQSKLENVTFLNSLQISTAERFVYSTDGEFSLAREMITSHPINRTGRRPILA